MRTASSTSPRSFSAGGSFARTAGVTQSNFYTYFKGEKVSLDPWDARTLEWSLPNPVPEYNFRVIPTVHARDGWWYEKHHQDEVAKEQKEHAQAEEAHGGADQDITSALKVGRVIAGQQEYTAEEVTAPIWEPAPLPKDAEPDPQPEVQAETTEPDLK